MVTCFVSNNNFFTLFDSRSKLTNKTLICFSREKIPFCSTKHLRPTDCAPHGGFSIFKTKWSLKQYMFFTQTTRKLAASSLHCNLTVHLLHAKCLNNSQTKVIKPSTKHLIRFWKSSRRNENRSNLLFGLQNISGTLVTGELGSNKCRPISRADKGTDTSTGFSKYPAG